MSDTNNAIAKEVPRVPEGVPSDAFWDAGYKYWRVGAVGEGGVLQGPHRLFRPSGPLFAEVTYVDGKAEGTYRRYHPNGELAREGEYRRGTPIGREVAYSSSDKTDEPLQKCCVPPGAVKLVLNHFDGGYFEEDFYDAHERALLPDGELRPNRPAAVAAEARYKPHDNVWRTEVFVKGKRSGTWRVWSSEGELLERVEHEDNHIHGVREVWRSGVMQSTWQYVCGVRHGAGWEVVPANTCENAAIVVQRGEFGHGIAAGKWLFEDRNGTVLFHVDLGPALNDLSEHDVVFTGTTCDGALVDSAHPMLRYLFAVRQAASQGKDALQAVLSKRPVWVATVSERWLHALQRERLDKNKYLARLLEGLCRGASVPDVACVMARLLLASPAVALNLVELGLVLAPNHVELLAVRVLALVELGDLPQALVVTSQLEPLHPPTHADLTALLRVTFPEFGFWPNNETLEIETSEELPQAVAQDAARVRATAAKLALRLKQVRVAINQRLQAELSPNWLPPELSDWPCLDATTLERYEFDSEADEGEAADHIVVDENLDLQGYAISDLMNRARIDWTALCWLSFGVGLKAVGLPDVLGSNPDFGRALTTAFARLYRVADQLKTRGHRARAQGLPDARWEGLLISTLPERLLIQAQAEFSEMRAVLFFLADGSCRSLWQDDLRG